MEREREERRRGGKEEVGRSRQLGSATLPAVTRKAAKGCRCIGKMEGEGGGRWVKRVG